MTALEKLAKKNSEGKLICVGLDTDAEKIPAHFKMNSDAVFEFNKAIIQSTSDLAAAYKLNLAFYEKDGYDGLQVFEKTISLIPEDLLIIADAKRGDIGNTSRMYARSIFEHYRCDSITVNPYMGEDSVQPFLNDSAKLVFILALTSNPGAADFEKLELSDGSMLFQRVIAKVNDWNSKKNCGIVFGATKADELRENIRTFRELPVLLPGVGAQGGSLDEVVKIFAEAGRLNMIINVSRGIIYKSSGEDFAESARNELLNMNASVKNLLDI